MPTYTMSKRALALPPFGIDSSQRGTPVTRSFSRELRRVCGRRRARISNPWATVRGARDTGTALKVAVRSVPQYRRTVAPRAHPDLDLPGVHPASNIQDHELVYELENQAADPAGRLEVAMRAIEPWDDRLLLDLGAGTGFHLPRFAASARHVLGVEPHGPSRRAAMERCARLGLTNVSILTGSAGQLLLDASSVDVVHARFAYFFGPGCEPGLAEVERVLRPGGVAFIVDNDRGHGTFAAWLARSPWAPSGTAETVEHFWLTQGFHIVRVPSEWRFKSRENLEAVVRIEFPAELAEELLSEHTGTSIEYHYAIYWRRYGSGETT